MDEGNTQDFADDKLCFYDSKNDEEHGLDMLYDNALDDGGPMLIDNPPCLVFITLCEDKNDILAACDNTLTHESPTLFLNYPIQTMEEKLAYVEKYLCGLQLSLVPNICYNHDIKPYIDLNIFLKVGSMLMNSKINLMILFMCLYYLS